MSTDKTMTVFVNPDTSDYRSVWAVMVDDTSLPFAVYPSGQFVETATVKGWRQVEVPIPDKPFEDGDVVDTRHEGRLVRVDEEWRKTSGGWGYWDDDEVRQMIYTRVGNLNEMGKNG